MTFRISDSTARRALRYAGHSDYYADWPAAPGSGRFTTRADAIEIIEGFRSKLQTIWETHFRGNYDNIIRYIFTMNVFVHHLPASLLGNVENPAIYIAVASSADVSMETRANKLKYREVLAKVVSGRAAFPEYMSGGARSYWDSLTPEQFLPGKMTKNLTLRLLNHYIENSPLAGVTVVEKGGALKLAYRGNTEFLGQAESELNIVGNLTEIRQSHYFERILREDDYRHYMANRYSPAGVSDLLVTLNTLHRYNTNEFLFQQYLQWRRGRVNEKINTADPVKTHDTTEQLTTFLTKVRRKKKADDFQKLLNLPLPGHGIKASRTWGIEVEAGGARGIEPPAGWDRKDDGSLSSAYGNHDSPSTFIAAEDCVNAEFHVETITQEITIDPVYDEHGNLLMEGYIETEEVENPDYEDPDYCSECGYIDLAYNEDYDYDTGEFVSPILSSFHSRGLEKLVERLSHEPQNDSAGIHVHVEAKDLTPRQIGKAVMIYEMFEPIIESFYYRDERGYCKQRDVSESVRIIHEAKRVQYKSYIEAGGGYSAGSSGKVLNPGDRYVTLNLCALSAHGTLEFRGMGEVYADYKLGARSYPYLANWAMYCREVVNLAASRVPIKEIAAAQTFEDILTIFARWGKEYARHTAKALDAQLSDIFALESVEV